jgi:hypothetical protein
MPADFPTILPSLTRLVATDQMNAPGKEGHTIVNEISDEIEAIAARVGITSSADNTSIDYKLAQVISSNALKAPIASPTFTGTVGGITSAMVGAPSGSGTSTGTNTGDSTATTHGALIHGAATKATPLDADELGYRDSVSGLLVREQFSDLRAWILSAIALAGHPKTIFATAIPFILFPGDGAAAGLSFNGGGGGAYTLSAEPLSGLFSGLSGRGCYAYLPANAGGSGCAAGWYYCVPSGATTGTIYNDQYTGGVPALVGSPTTFAGSPSGRITQTVAEIVAISGFTLTGNSLGNNGFLASKLQMAGDASATGKYMRVKLGGLSTVVSYATTNPVDERLFTMRNAGSKNAQTYSRQTLGVGTSTSGLSANYGTIDTSVDKSITISMQILANTGCQVIMASELTQVYIP